MHDDFAVLGQLRKVVLEMAHIAMPRTRDVFFVPLVLVAHVQHVHPAFLHPPGRLGGGRGGDRFQRQALVAPSFHASGEDALHRVDADARKRNRRLFHRFPSFGHQEDPRFLVGNPSAIGGHALEPDVVRTQDMGGSKGLGWAGIDHQALFHAALEFPGRQHAGGDRPLQRPSREQVHFFHVLEIGRACHLQRHLGFDKFASGLGEDVVRLAFDSQRGIIALRYVGPTCRTGAVRRKQQRLVAERTDLAVDGVVQDAGVLAGLDGVRQVGAPGIANEQRVPGEHPPALLAAVFGVDRVRHAFRRVAGRRERNEPGLADLEFLAVFQFYVDLAEQRVAAADNLGARRLHKRPRAKLEILLPMRLQHVGDGEVVFPRQAEILLNIPTRVDHDGESFAAPQDVGVVSEAWCLHPFEEHVRPPKMGCN